MDGIDPKYLANQLACDAVYSAVARTQPGPLPKEFLDRLLDNVRGNFEGLIDLMRKRG